MRGFVTRRDENEGAIVAELSAHGAYVARMSQPGVPDLLVAYQGRLTLLEVIAPAKAAKYRATGGLTPAQVRWHSAWQASGATPEIHKVRSRAEALKAVGVRELGREGA